MADAAQAVDHKQDQQQETPQQDAQIQAQNVEFSEVAESGNATPGASIDVLLDVNVPVTVIIDKTEVSVQRLLQLGPGSVLKLQKPVGAPVDLYLKDAKFAAGTIVVIDDRFAVRSKAILGAGITADSPDA
ncbi:MAG TPA: FliM/FliN family flagellar motor switch protein [Sedimentisphaerales bacterium]|nr:FliM/FliN family flagellar motor switch protein [Sedimentisphaerales bacterium]